MKKTPFSPDRHESEYDHALLRPLKGLKFYEVELIRADLFRYLDGLTTECYESSAAPELFASKDAEITRTMERLKEVMRFRSAALLRGVKNGSVDYGLMDHEECEEVPKVGPFSLPVWQECLEYWRAEGRG